MSMDRTPGGIITSGSNQAKLGVTIPRYVREWLSAHVKTNDTPYNSNDELVRNLILDYYKLHNPAGTPEERKRV